MRGGTIAITVFAVIAGLMILTRSPPGAPSGSDRPAADDAARITESRACQDRLDIVLKRPEIRVTAANRIEIDDRLWAEMDAATKRGLADTFACVAFAATPYDQLDAGNYVVVYGSRSGHRLAMVNQVGVTLE